METRKKQVIEQFGYYLKMDYNEVEKMELLINEKEKIEYVDKLDLFLQDENVKLPEILKLIIDLAQKNNCLTNFLEKDNIDIFNPDDLSNYLVELFELIDVNYNYEYDEIDLLSEYIVENGLIDDLLYFNNIELEDLAGISFDDYLDELDVNYILNNGNFYSFKDMILNPDLAVNNFENIQDGLMYDYGDYLIDYLSGDEKLEYLKDYPNIDNMIIEFLKNTNKYKIQLDCEEFYQYGHIRLYIREYLNIAQLYTRQTYIEKFGEYAFKQVIDDTIVFKKIRANLSNDHKSIVNDEIIELLLPSGAIIGFNLYSNEPIKNKPTGKCRASVVYLTDNTKINLFDRMNNKPIITLNILSIMDPEHYKFNINNLNIISMYDKNFIYEVGEIKPDEKFSFDLGECASGIHFFFTRSAAENY